MPILIEIITFLFLLFIILAFSPVGKILAQHLVGKNQENDLSKKIDFLTQKLEDQEQEIQKLREIVVFNDNKIKKLNSTKNNENNFI